MLGAALLLEGGEDLRKPGLGAWLALDDLGLVLALLFAGCMTLASDVTSVSFRNVPSAQEDRKATVPRQEPLPFTWPSSGSLVLS